MQNIPLSDGSSEKKTGIVFMKEVKNFMLAFTHEWCPLDEHVEIFTDTIIFYFSDKKCILKRFLEYGRNSSKLLFERTYKP